MQNGRVIASEALGNAVIGERAFTIRTPFRAASISKLATAMTALSLHRSGDIDWNASLHEILGLPAPGILDTLFTIPEFLSHTSGFHDPEIYWFAHPKTREDMQRAIAYTRQSPRAFEYSNFGYGWVATALEAATGRRFDHLARDLVFKRDGLDIGFNWSGVSEGKRKSGATLYRETSTGWQEQTDGIATLNGTEPSILIESDADLATYTPGQNGTLFSPQGGLRASLLDLAMLAGRLKYTPELTAPVWTLNATGSNGIHDSRYFTQFGTGVHIHPAEESIWPDQLLWGHHGEAYGLYAGAWYAPQLDISFAYAVTGTPETPPARSQHHPALNTFTEILMDAVIAAYDKSPAIK